MDGTGKTMRERNAMAFRDHCVEVIVDVSHVKGWINWDVLADAIKEVAGLALALVFVAASPVAVPLAGYIRMKAARTRFQQEITRQERVARMQSRVQKT